VLEWKNVEADVVILTIAQLLKRMDWFNAIQIVNKSLNEPAIFLSESCYNNILTHTSSDSRELGGLLIGRIYSLPYKISHRYPFVIMLTDAVPSREFKNSEVSLRMEAEVWSSTNSCMDNDKAIVGWYHSHPGIGAFFSGTDRATQHAFFKNPYSLGVVVNPVQNKWMSYSVPDSAEITSHLMLIEDGLLA